MSKQELRQLIRQRKRHFSQQELEEMSLAVITQLMEHPLLNTAQTLLLYYSLPDEVNTHQLVETLYQQGKTILLPVVTGDSQMELRIYRGVDSMHCGAYGIAEPTGERYLAYKDISLAIIPGMAFDADGHRLGRGKGYYDRFLTQLPDCYKIGICFAFQQVAHVPTQPTDIAIDEVIC